MPAVDTAPSSPHSLASTSSGTCSSLKWFVATCRDWPSKMTSTVTTRSGFAFGVDYLGSEEVTSVEATAVPTRLTAVGSGLEVNCLLPTSERRDVGPGGRSFNRTRLRRAPRPLPQKRESPRWRGSGRRRVRTQSLPTFHFNFSLLNLNTPVHSPRVDADFERSIAGLAPARTFEC